MSGEGYSRSSSNTFAKGKCNGPLSGERPKPQRTNSPANTSAIPTSETPQITERTIGIPKA